MKKYLLPEGKNSYKANLHSHSNLSDGHLTPEEMKKAYMEKGYSIIAYTDHDIMIDHSDLNEDGFLALRGFEMEVTEKKPSDAIGGRKTCHACFIALDEDNFTQPMWCRDGRYLFGNAKNYADKVVFDENEPDFSRVYSVECVSDMLKKGREKGFFVTYNHPVWSGENYEQYAYYEGMHAMEMCNFGCYEVGHPEYNSKIYDDMLRAGKRIYCISTDDNHNSGGERWAHDSFGAFTVIKADRLEYREITKALENGDFYASMGPEIHELYLEDNELHIKCSAAKRICLNVGRVKFAKAKCAKDGEYLTEASFKIDKEQDIYFRLDIYDENGKAANTNAYFCDEVFGD